MAAYLGMDDQVIRQRLEHATQHWERLAAVQIHQWHARLDGLLYLQQQRLVAMEWRTEGMPLTPLERVEGFYDLLSDMRDDRIESQEASVQALLERRLDGLYQAMDWQLPSGLDPLPASYEGHVDDALYRQVVELQSRVDHLHYGEQTSQTDHQDHHGLGGTAADDATMPMTRTSLWSGMTRTMDLPITREQLARWEGGKTIQNAMPHLTAAEREFVVSGMTDEEWQEMGRLEAAMDGEGEASDMVHLHERLDDMQQARQQERSHEQGMGY